MRCSGLHNGFAIRDTDGFAALISVWLWFTVLFANFAEAIAEGRGKAQAETLRKTRAETVAHGVFDVIFCRNVLIYFDDASRRVAAENLFENLAPGGFICLGHSESMSRISPLFEVCRFADAIVYRKPLRGGP